MKKLTDVKVGDIVYRYVSTIPTPMELVVTAITSEKIKCGDWCFSKITGGEIDEMLGWDAYNTGSVITAERR